MKTQLIIKRFFQGAGVLLLVLVFIALGKWQLDRAADLKTMQAAAKVVDQKVYSLNALAQPSVALDSRNVNKIVSVSGFYVANF